MCEHIAHIGENMPNMTLSIPKELHSMVKQHTEIRWSEVARRAMWQQAKKLMLMERLTSKSKLTEHDINDIDHKIKANLLRRYA